MDTTGNLAGARVCPPPIHPKAELRDFLHSLDRAGLSGSTRAIAAALWTYTDKRGGCWPSQATLARVSGYSVRTVQRASIVLVAAGVLVRDVPTLRERRWCRRTTVYGLRLAEQRAARRSSVEPVRPEVSAPAVEPVHVPTVSAEIATGAELAGEDLAPVAREPACSGTQREPALDLVDGADMPPAAGVSVLFRQEKRAPEDGHELARGGSERPATVARPAALAAPAGAQGAPRTPVRYRTLLARGAPARPAASPSLPPALAAIIARVSDRIAPMGSTGNVPRATGSQAEGVPPPPETGTHDPAEPGGTRRTT